MARLNKRLNYYRVITRIPVSIALFLFTRHILLICSKFRSKHERRNNCIYIERLILWLYKIAFVNEEVGAFAYFYQTFFSMETFPEKNQDELIIRNSKKSDSNSSEDKKKRKGVEDRKIRHFGSLSFYIYNWRVTASSKPLQLILKGDVYYRKLWTVGRASADFYSSGRINVR